MGYHHANLHLLHMVITEFQAVPAQFQFILPPVSIILGRFESALTLLGSAGTAGNCSDIRDPNLWLERVCTKNYGTTRKERAHMYLQILLYQICKDRRI